MIYAPVICYCLVVFGWTGGFIAVAHIDPVWRLVGVSFGSLYLAGSVCSVLIIVTSSHGKTNKRDAIKLIGFVCRSADKAYIPSIGSDTNKLPATSLTLMRFLPLEHSLAVASFCSYFCLVPELDCSVRHITYGPATGANVLFRTCFFILYWLVGSCGT